MPLEFLNPWAWALAALAVPVIAAFLNRRRVRERVAPSLVILRQLQTDRPSQRRRFAVPRHLLALLLYLLALLGVVFSGAEPVTEDEAPRTHWIVVDTSASMGTREPDQLETRLERARQGLEAEVFDRARQRDRVGLIASGARAQVLVEPTRDFARVRQALGELSPTGQGRAHAEALALAGALCQADARAHIVWATDAAGPAGGLELPESCPARALRVGGPAANLAVTELAVREADALGLIEVYLEVMNTGEEPRDVSVDLSMDGQLIEVASLRAPAGGQVGRLVRLEPGRGRVVSARLRAEEGDALAADDRAWAARHDPPVAKALLISKRASSFLGHALDLHPGAEVTRLAPTDPIPEGRWDLVVLEDEPALGRLEDLPKASHIVALGVALEPLGFTVAGRQKRPAVRWWDFDAELLRYVDLDRVEIKDAALIEVDGASKEMLVSHDMKHALMATGTWKGRPVLALGFHPEQSDLVLRVAFANLVANLIEWTGVLKRGQAPRRLHVGDLLEGVEEGWRLAPLSGQPAERPVAGPLTEPGAWELRDVRGASQGVVLVNLLSTPEAHLTSAQGDAEAGEASPGRAPGATGSRAEDEDPWSEWLWRAPLLLALALLSVELFLPSRRRRRRRRGPEIDLEGGRRG